MDLKNIFTMRNAEDAAHIEAGDIFFIDYKRYWKRQRPENLMW